MFARQIILQPKEHADLRVSETTDWHFAGQEMVVPIVFTELADAAREYPLVFLKDKPLVCALTGLEQGQNAYVDANGRWLGTYIPARLRSYPFKLGRVSGKEKEFALILDAEAPQVASAAGYSLFENGKPSVFLNHRTKLLTESAKAEPVTASLVETIRSAGLLVDKTIHMRRQGQKDLDVGGLQVVDEKKLNELPHEQFAALRDKGVLPLIYAHLLSMANLRRGPIAGKYPQLADAKVDAVAEMLKSPTLRFN